YEVNLTGRLNNFLSGVKTGSDGIEFSEEAIFSPQDRRLDLLNLRYLLIRSGSAEFERLKLLPDRYALAFQLGDISVFGNKAALPRTFLVAASGMELIGRDDLQIERLKDAQFDPRRNVILSRKPPEFSDVEPSSNFRVFSPVELVSAEPNGFEFRVQTSVPA